MDRGGEPFRRGARAVPPSRPATALRRAATIVVVALIAIWPFGAAQSAPPAPIAVLYLNSYHQGFPWSDNITRGIRETFAKSSTEIDLWVEYMDTKRFPGGVNTERLYGLYHRKYRKKRFAAIIASDNAAFDFVLNYRTELFGNAPVVFCGVNHFSPETIAGQRNITGIAESPDYKSTIDLAPRLFPDTHEVVIAMPDTITAVADKKLIETIAPTLRPRLKISFWEGLELEELEARASTLKPGTVILSNGVVRTRAGQLLSGFEKVKNLAHVAQVPVLVAREDDFGSGALGGRMISGLTQGRQAAGLVLDILGGKKADDLPVVTEGANPYMFDYKAMMRFGVSRSQLPEGSIVINRPPPPFQRYEGLFWAALAVILVLGAFISGLVFLIAKRRRAEAALRESEGRLRAFLDYSTAGIFLKDMEGRYVLVNKALAQRYGLPIEEVVGRIATELQSPEMAAVTESHDAEVAATRAPREHEVQMTYADGTRHSHLVFKFPVFDSEGDLSGIGGISTDISDLKSASEATRALQAELAYVGRLSSMGEMAAGFAHELNQPLAAIGNFASGCIRRVQRGNNDGNELLPAMREIYQQAQRAGDIIRRIRGFVGNKGYEGIGISTPVVDINVTIRTAANLVSSEALLHGVDMSLQLAPSILRVKADAIQIQQLLVNLSRNAIEAMNEAASARRKLTIRTAALSNKWVEIRVFDTGPGIPQEIRDRLFEPFFTTKASGMGMGLSICRSIVDAHGGEMTAVNRRWGGADFSVRLPAAQPAAAD